jgi:hypothetical protein
MTNEGEVLLPFVASVPTKYSSKILLTLDASGAFITFMKGRGLLCLGGGALKKALFLSIGIFVLLTGSRSNAVDIIYHYEGTITEIVNIGAPSGPPVEWTTLFQLGRTWTLDFTVDAAAPDLVPEDPNFGKYLNSGRNVAFNLENGLYRGTLSGDGIHVSIGRYGYRNPFGTADEINMWLSTVYLPPGGSQLVHFPAIGGLQLNDLGVKIQDPTNLVLPNDALPTSLSGMQNGTFQIDWSPNGGFYFYEANGTISLQIAVTGPTVTRSGNILTFTWPAGFILQSAPNVTGPYTDISTTNTGFDYDVTSAPRQFFRLRN